MRIACLHTIGANVAVFDAAAAPLGLTVEHAVRDDLLKSAEAAGGTTPEIDRRTADALLELVPKADAILLTCSTVGRGAELAAAESKIPIVRVDAALAEQVVAAGGRAMVLCAAATTLEPTRRLFERTAQGASIEIDYELVPGAWALYKAGDITGYARAIAAAADAAYAAGYTTVALAQASMACAGEFTTKGVPLASPAAGLAAAARVRQA